MMMKNEDVIIDYFDTCEIHYRRLWDLQHSMAMHYGYWDSNTKNFREALQNENKLMAQLINIRGEDIVLDAGSGVGGSAIYLAKEFGCKAIGVTLSEKQVETSRNNAEKHGVSHLVEFHQRSFTETGFPDEFFTVIWALESVCYCSNKRDFLEEAYRLLKKGGRIIIADGFLREDTLTRREEKHMHKWHSGWRITNFTTESEFMRNLELLEFQNSVFKDITEYVMPSSKRMLWPSLAMFPVAKILEWLRIRKKVQTQHVLAAIYQWITLRKKIWKYGICYAQK